MSLRTLWSTLTKPREAFIPRVVRERALRRETAAHVVYDLRDERNVDRAIRAYLGLWLEETTAEGHHETALQRFGLDSDDVVFLDQVLCSAALRTLQCWVDGPEYLWWQAAWRLAASRDRVLLDQLRWQIERKCWS